ncbi:MAG: hypothetical protein HQM12_13790 [SAR324 cluster bacterium]|nr:hypothetical protein [SAR324 cluster bacterium]MBF0352168.1 hypothetical protein [SAR324 cluster bacterium]
MFNSFDPKEKKAIIVFFVVLFLGTVYLLTHDQSWREPPRPLPQDGAPTRFEDRIEQPEPRPRYDSERYF